MNAYRRRVLATTTALGLLALSGTAAAHHSFAMFEPTRQVRMTGKVIVAPLRTGEPGALLKQVRLADGSIFGNGGPAGPPNIPIE